MEPVFCLRLLPPRLKQQETKTIPYINTNKQTNKHSYSFNLTRIKMGCASSSQLQALEQRVRTLEDRLQAPNDFTQERLVQALSEKYDCSVGLIHKVIHSKIN